MKVSETVTRECCQPKDLKPYNGEISPATFGGPKPLRKYLSFCTHCGQIWKETSQGDAAGGTETVMEKVNI